MTLTLSYLVSIELENEQGEIELKNEQGESVRMLEVAAIYNVKRNV